ncbi:Mtrex [Symbiodinium pilosum]|uniref:Mtrex protein n=1 Tax=Symbiodinium pilosum TaxID=2952 RepID=A0A812J0F9_SYMPI|nr:Mtrex [Symbiodinium pilosum]
MLALAHAESAVVAAPTSAGKTVVGEFAMVQALDGGGSVIFCSPTKALSNQKFLDFYKLFPQKVGLLTGDVSISRRSMLCHHADFERVKTVIFDEVHYIGDTERGSVWEEAIILLPAHVNLLCLSATVPNCLDLAGWICQTRHCVCHAVVKQSRPTPLRVYGIADITCLLVDTESGTFLEDNFQKLHPGERSAEDILHGIAANTRLTPALAFMFSKVACQTFALALGKRFNQAEVVASLIAEYHGARTSRLKGAIKFWASKKIARLCPITSHLRTDQAQQICSLTTEALLHLPEEDRGLEQATMWGGYV